MKISIITPTYNSVSTIAECILSINNQSYSNIEHIIIDGASQDNTIEIIKNTPNRITKIISEPDNGIYDAMNKGISIATGDIVGILNSDDFYIHNQVISKVIQCFNENDVDIVHANLIHVNWKNTNKINRIVRNEPYKEGIFEKGWIPQHPTFFVRRNLYLKYGIFNTKYTISADDDIMFRFLEVHKASSYFLDEFIVKMRDGGASTNLKASLKGNKEFIQAMKSYGYKVPFFYLPYRYYMRLNQFFFKAKNKIYQTNISLQ